MSEHITPESVGSEIDNLLNEAESEAVEGWKDQQQAQQQQLAASEDEWKTIIQEIAGPGLALLAPGWNVKPAEVEALASAYAAVLNKYFPGGAGSIGPELGACLVTVAIVGPRLKMPRKLPEASGDDPGEVPAHGG